jgi:histidinol-phosphate aminotransferase
MSNQTIIQPRPAVMATHYDQHGAFDYAELEALGVTPDEIIDFSVNINPFGTSPVAVNALKNVVIDRYPDQESLALRRALAQHLNLIPAQIAIGNGTAELLWLLAAAFVEQGDDILILGPTFGEYARSVSLFGGKVETLQAQPENHFHIEPKHVENSLDTLKPRLAFICTPNNPTGVVITPEFIHAWAEAHPNTLFVIDEAYRQFVLGFTSCLSLNLPNVVILHSMTKDYAMAGLRLGYAAGQEHIIDAIARTRPPWNVNAAAQAVGLAALHDTHHLQTTLAQLMQAKADLLVDLTNLGIQPNPSQTHYMLLHVGDAADFRRRLLKHRIQVRDCASFGWPEYVRISTRTPEDNGRLITAIKEVLA